MIAGRRQINPSLVSDPYMKVTRSVRLPVSAPLIFSRCADGCPCPPAGDLRRRSNSLNRAIVYPTRRADSFASGASHPAFPFCCLAA
jgi:hypothetical protein